MHPEDSIAYLNRHFSYISDKKNYRFYEVWRIMRTDFFGDCEDYALTLLWLICGKSKLKMIWYLLIRRARIYFYRNKETKTGHAVLWLKNYGYADNISAHWNDGGFLEVRGYRRFPISFPVVLILLKMFIGFFARKFASLV